MSYGKDTVNMRYNKPLKTYNILIYSKNGQDADSFNLYIDDGISIVTDRSKYVISFKNGKLFVNGTGQKVRNVSFVGTLITGNNQSGTKIPVSIKEDFSPSITGNGRGKIFIIIIGIIAMVLLIILVFKLLKKSKVK
jgi:hypothetical protein